MDRLARPLLAILLFGLAGMAGVAFAEPSIADPALLRREMEAAHLEPARAVTLRGATQVQAVLAALCALPPVPAGQHCAAASAGCTNAPLVLAVGSNILNSR